MEKVAVLNLKGGCGKTTTAVSVAYILAKNYKKNVLLIDCDMQGNASKVLKSYDPDSRGTHTIMQQQEAPEFCIKTTPFPEISTFSGKVDVIPANMYLMQANAEIMRDTENEQLHRLKNTVDRLEELGKKYKPFQPAFGAEPDLETSLAPYDVAIFDCALGLDMTVLNAVIASDLIIAPVMFGGYELDGLYQLQEQLDDLKAIKTDLWLKALFTMKQGNKANREFEQWLQNESGIEAYKTAIRRSVTVQKATLEEMPLPHFSKRGSATKDYEAVTAELMEDLKEIREGRE